MTRELSSLINSVMMIHLRVRLLSAYSRKQILTILLEHGYIPGLDIVLSTEPLINDNSILLRPSLMREFVGYADERDTPT